MNNSISGVKEFADSNIERMQPYFYWLFGIAGIGDDTIIRLLDIADSPEALYYASDEQIDGWQQSGILRPAQAKNLKYARRKTNLYSTYDEMCAKGIEMFPFYHPRFPERLRNIPNPPCVLFVKGRVPDPTEKSVAIIGARNCSRYGQEMAREFATAMAEAGVQIISGMALGIDGIGQAAAIKAGGTSFAVLGCGVDICYPAQNRYIYEELPGCGGVISTYLPGTEPLGKYFPPRNRIISGLSDALLVIEAREKSGTLITVDMALEQGKEVYAVPGRLGDAISEGCNRLIAQGAGIALSPGMLIEELTGAEHLRELTDSAPVMLEGAELKLYNILDYYPQTFDEIYKAFCATQKDKTDVNIMMSMLLNVCLKGYAKQLNGGMVYIKEK